jgi:hypothetical protein
MPPPPLARLAPAPGAARHMTSLSRVAAISSPSPLAEDGAAYGADQIQVS